MQRCSNSSPDAVREPILAQKKPERLERYNGRASVIIADVHENRDDVRAAQQWLAADEWVR